MRITTVFILITATAFSSLGGCGSGSNNGPAPGVDASTLAVTALEVTPDTVTLEAVDDTVVQQSFTVMATLADGTTVDVSTSAMLSVDNIHIGQFEGNVFSTSNRAGGQATVSARYGDVTANTSLTVHLRRSHIDPALPQAPSLFAAATADPALAPAILYPADNTMFPPNLGEFDIHWRDNAGHDLFEIAITGDYVDIRMYASGAPNDSSWVTLEPAQWAMASNSQRGGSLQVAVRSLATAAPQSMGSALLTAHITPLDLEGGIYYWASNSVNGPGGIYRHDMGRGGAAAEQFYTVEESVDNRCVGCHSLSRDGTRMAVTLDGGNGAGTILDVATRTPLLPTDGSFSWNYASFTSDGSRMVAVHKGVLTLYRTANGEVLGTVPTNGYATQPDISPRNTAVVYVRPTVRSSDESFQGGVIVVQPFDPATNTFGEARTLVEGNGNNYYPSWSPDARWILFNRSSGDAYDDSTAELYVIQADGSSPPIRLDSPNVRSGITNSWARWTPFEQRSGASEEPLLWFTFSSKRDFGARLVGAARPQVWMAPFFPWRAAAGQDASAPAFRLPAQTLDSNNHIAQWTEKVVAIE